MAFDVVQLFLRNEMLFIRMSVNDIPVGNDAQLTDVHTLSVSCLQRRARETAR